VRQLCTTLLNCYLIQARARGRLARPRAAERAGAIHSAQSFQAAS